MTTTLAWLPKEQVTERCSHYRRFCIPSRQSLDVFQSHEIDNCWASQNSLNLFFPVENESFDLAIVRLDY